jgi:DNA-binding response OmpR family regulator
MPRASVLVIDDDEDVRVLVREMLERADFAVTDAAGGLEGLRQFHETRPDLVVLDVAMPAVDGWRVLDNIRTASDVPVLMLTIRSRELEVVRGLRLGADDYVAKPFGRQELLARVEALLRRAGQRRTETSYADGLLAIDFARRRVVAAGVELPLTPLEFKLLAVLVRNAGQVVSTEQLYELVWGDTRSLSRDEARTYVSYLRRKLDRVGAGRAVETVRGFGYRYRPVVEAG